MKDESWLLMLPMIGTYTPSKRMLHHWYYNAILYKQGAIL